MKQDDIHQAVHCCPKTGVCTWKERKDVGRWWNLRYAGKRVGGVDAYGYLTTAISGSVIKVHRLVWIYFNGEIADGAEIDHINGIRTDNRIENLRLANDHQNAWNAGVRRDNRSGMKGVSWHARIKKWQAQININGKRKSLGYFSCPRSASRAYKNAAEKHHGEFMRS